MCPVICARLACKDGNEGFPESTVLSARTPEVSGASTAAFVPSLVCEVHKVVKVVCIYARDPLLFLQIHYDVTEFSRRSLLDRRRLHTCFLKTGILQLTGHALSSHLS